MHDLTWREFLLKKDGYIREIINRQHNTRLVAYFSLVATGAIDTKKMSIEKFMPIGAESKHNNLDYQKELLLEARKQAMEEAKQKKLSNG